MRRSPRSRSRCRSQGAPRPTHSGSRPAAVGLARGSQLCTPRASAVHFRRGEGCTAQMSAIWTVAELPGRSGTTMPPREAHGAQLASIASRSADQLVATSRTIDRPAGVDASGGRIRARPPRDI
jgi:hypothetical protein